MGEKIKELLAADRLVKVFALGRVVHPVVIDLFGLAGGYDALWLDQEHAGLTYEQIVSATVAARANGFDTFVRMAPLNYSLVTQNLEAGAGGVMAARIDTAAQAEEFVTWCKFAPRGNRGMNNSGRDADYTHKGPAQFAADTNRDHFVAIQIETVGALNEVDRIAAIDGVELLFVGPTDLAQALGVLGQLGHEKVWEGIDRVAAACRRHGKHWATIAVDPAYADKAVDKGCRMLNFGSDVLSIRRGIESIKSAFTKQFG